MCHTHLYIRRRHYNIPSPSLQPQPHLSGGIRDTRCHNQGLSGRFPLASCEVQGVWCVVCSLYDGCAVLGLVVEKMGKNTMVVRGGTEDIAAVSCEPQHILVSDADSGRYTDTTRYTVHQHQHQRCSLRVRTEHNLVCDCRNTYLACPLSSLRLIHVIHKTHRYSKTAELAGWIDLETSFRPQPGSFLVFFRYPYLPIFLYPVQQYRVCVAALMAFRFL